MQVRFAAALAVALVACRGEGPAAVAEPPGAAARVAPTAPPEPEPAPEVAEEPVAVDEAPWPPEARMDAFTKALARCEDDEGRDGTTMQMADAMRRSAACVRAELDAMVARLPPDARATFATPPAPTGKNAPPFPPLSPFDRLVEASGGVEDSLQWVHGAQRNAGTMRFISAATAGSFVVTRTLFLLDAWVRGDASAAAESVRARAPLAARAVASFPVARAGAARLRDLAPDDLVFDDEAMTSTLTDADWLRYGRRISGVEAGAREIADAVCAGFSGLSAELGGPGACRASLAADLALHAVGRALPDPSAGVTPADYAGEPPPRGADARRVLEPVIEACWKGESLRYSSEVFDASALACVRAAATLPPSVEAAWRRFEATACDLEALTADAAPTYAVYDRHTRYGGSAVVRKTTCPLAAAADRVVFARLAEADPAALARHVEARAGWAKSVRAGADALAATGAKPTCANKWGRSTEACRTATIDAGAWARLAKTKASLQAAAHTLAIEACRVPGAPTDACAEELTEHFVAQASFVGLATKP